MRRHLPGGFEKSLTNSRKACDLARLWHGFSSEGIGTDIRLIRGGEQDDSLRIHMHRALKSQAS